MEDRNGRYEGILSTTQSLPAWKEEVNAKLNEHRSRRNLPPDAQSRLAELEPSFATRPRERATSNIAARVAERYSRVPSYREMLEQEAAKAPARLITPDTEAAPVLAAEPIQRAAQRDPEPSLFENEPVPIAAPASIAAQAAAGPVARLGRWAEFSLPAAREAAATPVAAPPIPEIEFFAGAAQPASLLPVEEELTATIEPFAQDPAIAAEPEPVQESEEEAATRMLLEELAATPREPAQPLPARIIEFPRELVAPYKARPRQERSPEDVPEEVQPQLRIFEADSVIATSIQAAAIETEIEPEAARPAAPAPAAPKWNTIRLDEEPEASTSAFFDEFPVKAEQSSLLLDPPIYTANIEDRLMAGIVDLCLIGAGFLVFVAAFVTYTSHLPTGKAGLIACAAALLGLFVAYQFLFLNFAEATPGMRYAKIALCTFDDDNLTREAMRARIGAILLSALPLGLGFLWSLFDEDRLGWHDRMTRTYQRSYRES